MRLKSFNYLVGLLIFLLFLPLASEEKVDIWSNNKKSSNSSKEETKQINKDSNLNKAQTIESLDKIEIQEGSEIQSDGKKVYGIYEPANYDLNLNMWSTTKAEDLRSV